MPSAAITVKGQTTIPKKIRDHLNLHAGDQLDFVIEESGKVVIRPATIDVKDLEGILHRPGMKAISVEEMKTVIKKRYGKR